MEVDSSAPKVFENKDPENGVYKLQSFVTHLGASLGSGHYVAHVKSTDDDSWVYYNDDKVAKMDDPPIGKGYLYFLRK